MQSGGKKYGETNHPRLVEIGECASLPCLVSSSAMTLADRRGKTRNDGEDYP